MIDGHNLEVSHDGYQGLDRSGGYNDVELEKPVIARHRTAIRRHDFSLPIKCLLRDGLVDANTSLFDFGCGHGENIGRLNSQGIRSSGWDPVYRPDQPIIESDVVNLGYVINVIEDPTERAATLRRAWDLSTKLLVVSAQIKMSGRGNSCVEFGDGIVTTIGTFQKFYSQAELRDYIESELGAETLPAAPGVIYVFKDEVLQQQFLSSRYRRHSTVPRKRIAELRFEEHRALLEQLISTITDLGRLPHPEEFWGTSQVIEHFGSLSRAYALIRHVTGEGEWEQIRQRRIEDLLVFLALSRFRRRPPISKLPQPLQWDIREFLGTYKHACGQSDDLLFQAGKPESIDEACKRSRIGKLLPDALYLHRSSVDLLEPVLRIYEGCARTYLGEIEDTNIVKLHRVSGKVSYLAYPDFETDPHPALMRSVKLNLRTLELDCWDYYDSKNPPVLHRKETFLPKDHPLFSKFDRLTKQEQKQGLLDDTATIGTRNGWEFRLKERGFALRGHRLVKSRENADQSDSA